MRELITAATALVLALFLAAPVVAGPPGGGNSETTVKTAKGSGDFTVYSYRDSSFAIALAFTVDKNGDFQAFLSEKDDFVAWVPEAFIDVDIDSDPAPTIKCEEVRDNETVDIITFSGSADVTQRVDPYETIHNQELYGEIVVKSKRDGTIFFEVTYDGNKVTVDSDYTGKVDVSCDAKVPKGLLD